MITFAFLATCTAIVVAPGPAFTVLVSQSLRAGTSAGMYVVAGNSTALGLWATASAVGLTALATTSVVGFSILKFIGVAYLGWLGARALLRSWHDVDNTAAHSGQVLSNSIRRSRASAYRQGLLTSLANPKPAALYLALLPQFLPGGAGLTSLLALAATHIAISATWFTLLVASLAAARPKLCSPTVRRWIDRASGIVLIGLGIHLLGLTRPA